MVSAQQVNLSEFEGRKNIRIDTISVKSISLKWDSAVILNFPMVAQSPYYMCVYVCIYVYPSRNHNDITVNDTKFLKLKDW